MGYKQQSAISVLAPFLTLCVPGQMDTELRIVCKNTKTVMHKRTRNMPGRICVCYKWEEN